MRFSAITRNVSLFLIIPLTLAFAITAAGAPPVSPPPPKEYDVQLRYHIFAARNQRIAQFFALTKKLESYGFKKEPAEDEHYEPQDPYETRMSGTIASANVRKLLQDSRVKALLLTPAGYELPKEAGKPVKVQLELANGLTLPRQRYLADQVRVKLAELGFREAIGYDHRGHTRLVGTVPVQELETLLADLRYKPSGWLVPDQPAARLPDPLRLVSPVRITEVIPEPEGVPPAKEPPPPPESPAKGAENLQKIAPEVRALAAQEGQGKPERMEVIINFIPENEDQEHWRQDLLSTTAGLLVEGRMGTIVTVLASPKAAAALANLPFVTSVRLPRPALASLRQGQEGKADNAAILKASGLEQLHQQGQKGRGVRVAVIDSDFRGYQQFLGKQLPIRTRLFDFTAERNYSLEPDPIPGEPQGIGHGTQCALALALAAPEGDLTLVRVDPGAPYQLQVASRLIKGERYRSYCIEQRIEELEADASRLAKRREALLEERAKVLENFGQEKEAVDQREAYFKKQAELDQDERAYHQRQRRLDNIIQGQKQLQGIQIVSSSLVWNDGYPLGGSSGFSRFLDDQPFKCTLWFQSAGNNRGQAWTGQFRDTDGNQVMEFGAAERRLPSDWWQSELNFLAWQPHGQKPTFELPAKAQVRLSLQWREPHDPELFRGGEDPYREPLARLSLVVLRQRDPSGTKLATDDFEVIARSSSAPQRLDNRPSSALYEQTVEFAVDTAGRYALRVEGAVPPGTRPPSVPTLPMLTKFWELRPRIGVDVVDGASRLTGRPLFRDYVTELGNLGMPADAHAAITVGAVNQAGERQGYSTNGPPWGMELLTKPNVLVFDGLRLPSGREGEAFGADLAAPFAAGMAAVSLGSRTQGLEKTFQLQPPQLFRLP